MMDAQDDVHSRFKLAQLWNIVNHACRETRNADSYRRIVDNILSEDFDVNCKVTPELSTKGLDDDFLKDCTALHFVYRYERYPGYPEYGNVLDIDTFNKLIERGADFTMKNGMGKTVLHSIITARGPPSEEKLSYANSVLSAHVKFRIAANPRDDEGISHLHGACFANHLESLRFFLDNGAPIDQTDNVDCKRYSGFTPLHFAAQFDNFEAAQMLVSRGANVQARDAGEMTAMDVCMRRRLDLLSQLSSSKIMAENPFRKIYRERLCKNEKVMKLLLESGSVSAVGLTPLQIACTFEDLTVASGLLDQVVDVDRAVPRKSQICPAGCTAAHFAAKNSIDAVKMLVTRAGAKLDIADAEGSTALDYCIKKYSIQEVHDALSCSQEWRAAVLTDGETKLLDLLLATASADRVKLFLENHTEDLVVPSDWPSWPGFGVLHLAVAIGDKSVVEECLRLRVQSIDVQNAKNGETLVHVAFNSGKKEILKLLLEHLDGQKNLADHNNLSYLHIACVEKNASLVEKLLRVSGPNVSCTVGCHRIVAGSTPLHIAAYEGTVEIAQMLLQRGADLHATDANGMTPIHYLLKDGLRGSRDRPMANVLLDSLITEPRDVLVHRIGLNYLHVACFVGHAQAVQKLLELGSDVSAVVTVDNSTYKRSLIDMTPDLKPFSTFTPLHMVQSHPVAEVIDLLLTNGADVFTRSLNESVAPLQHDDVMRRFMTLLWDKDDMQRATEEKLGLTGLHVACYMKDEQKVRSALNDDVDVNARIVDDSCVFAGCTPLHLLLSFIPDPADPDDDDDDDDDDNDDDVDDDDHDPVEQVAAGPTIELLLERGASVTLQNAKKITAIHLVYEHSQRFNDADRCEDSLWNAHRDFSVNPVNAEGLSHFHLACFSHKPEIVEKFLQHGSVDINRPVDFFAAKYPGSTPLHFALCSSRMPIDDWTNLERTVDLLLEHGANVAAKDVFGNTPLHESTAFHSPDYIILNKLLSHGADVKAENVKGQTLLDICPLNSELDCVGLFKKYNYQINSWNRLTGEGYIAHMLLLGKENVIESPEFKELMQSSDVRAVDEMGRTVVHNSVAVLNYPFGNEENVISAIGEFNKLGINIDHQDESGQTALHYAARMGNVIGVIALLKCGAEVNVLDNSWKSAFFYVWESMVRKYHRDVFCSYATEATLHLHVKKLLHLGIEVSELNENLSNRIQTIADRSGMSEENSIDLSPEFYDQVEMSKTVHVGTASLALFDFLNETGGVTLYPYLPISEQTVINNFFKDFDRNEFDELCGIINLQFRKMTARLDLIDQAMISLRALLGFSFPGLCEEIARFLLNSDLEKLIASTAIEEGSSENSNWDYMYF